MGRELGILLHKVVRAIPGAFILILWGQGNQALHSPAGAGPADLLPPALGMLALAALGAWIGRARSGEGSSAGIFRGGRLPLAALAGLAAFVLGVAGEAIGSAGLASALARGSWHALSGFALVFGIIGRSGRAAADEPPVPDPN